MLNFTVGPVQSNEMTLNIGKNQVPYFRTSEFSQVMLDSEKLMKEFSKASDSSKVVFMTGSGTLSMEASIINTLAQKDKVLIVNGGSFSKRFVEICIIHQIECQTIDLEIGKTLTASDLLPFENKGFTAFVVNVHETSTGVHYDLKLMSDFCKRNNLFFIVDAISSFLADEINMHECGIDVLITGSQKALACPPGISIIVLSQKAVEKVENNNPHSLYLDLKSALKNQERGQTPFTPAVGILLQINARLNQIKNDGGIDTETAKIKAIADDFRKKIKDFPFEIVSNSLSNAVTPLKPLTASATDIFTILKDEYGIWICPNGGELKDVLFRVGHIGNLTTKDNDTLIEAFKDLHRRNII